MTEEELQAIGVNLPDATDFLATQEEIDAFHQRLDDLSREAFAAYDLAAKKTWAASFTRLFC